jgi:hypothetical protein
MRAHDKTTAPRNTRESAGVMSEAALLAELEAMLNDPNYDPVAAIVEGERKRGFRVIRPGEASWFRVGDWKPESVASMHGTTIRLVLIDAYRPGTGAFTRMIRDIEEIGGRPAVLEPTKEFSAMLKRRGWRGTATGHTFETRETIWRPK